MLFRRMKCSRCGAKLKRQKITSLGKKWVKEPGVQPILGRQLYLDKSNQVDSYCYRCPGCGAITDYDEQLRISKLQKKLGKTIL